MCRRCWIGEKRPRDYHVAVLFDPVTHAPVRPAAGRMLAGVFVTQRMATRRGLSSSGPVMNSAAAAAIFSGSRASWRCARGRTSSFQRPAGPVTQRRRHETGEQSRGGKRPRPGRGPSSPPPAPHPRQHARAASRRHHAVDSADSSSCSRCHSSPDISTTGWCPGLATATGPRPASTSSAAAASRSASLRCSSLTTSVCSRQPAGQVVIPARGQPGLGAREQVRAPVPK